MIGIATTPIEIAEGPIEEKLTSPPASTISGEPSHRESEGEQDEALLVSIGDDIRALGMSWRYY